MFAAVNGLPDAIHGPTWVVMQTGALGGALAAGTVAAGLGHRRLGLRLAAWGTVTWATAKALKPLAGRGRPADLLAEVRIRGAAAGGLGLPSGHAAVATTIAALVAADGHRRAAVVMTGAAAVTGLARLYVGAHLPLDVVAGWLLGGAIGTLAGVISPAAASGGGRRVWHGRKGGPAARSA